MKRANKTGTVIKRRDKKRRKPFCVYLDGGRDPDTFRRRRIFLGSFETAKAAQEYLEKYRTGTVVQPTKEITLKEIWDLYEDNQKALGKPVPGSYVSMWNKYIKPKLANEAVSQIKTMHLQNVVNNCKSANCQAQIKSVFCNLFRYAMANDLALKDYSASVKTLERKVSTLHRPFTMEELGWLWQNVNKDAIKAILIQTYTGLRMSELAGILLENVHLKEQYMIGGVKTAAGKNRTIPIANCILPLVKHFYTISMFAHFEYLIMPDLNRGLFANEGRLNMRWVYRKNFPAHTTHDARHTFVTLAENAGVRSSTIKKIVGHAGGNVTEDVYTHKTIDQLLEAVNSLPYGPDLGTEQGSHRVAT